MKRLALGTFASGTCLVWALAASSQSLPAGKQAGRNFVKNPGFTETGGATGMPAGYVLGGAAEWVVTGKGNEFSERGIALRSSGTAGGSGLREGEVSQRVSGFPGGIERWFRFSFRGLPENGFLLTNDGRLTMRVDFFTNKGKIDLDGVARDLYPLVERDRKELAENGKFRKGGAAVWKTYALDFKLPFNEIDELKLSVRFTGGAAGQQKDAVFFVTQFSLTSITPPAEAPRVIKSSSGYQPALQSLIHLGGRWYYQLEPGLSEKPATLRVTSENAHRLFYMDNRLTNPFAENMTAWLRKGYMDARGNVVQADRFVADNVVLEFKDTKTMIVHARNIPNHPTAEFPERGPKKGNPSYIQEHDYTYYIPLNPVKNPNAVAMDRTNSNRALPMGATAIAINGVVFYNPFDIGMEDATDLMDRCCGHPSPDNRYHYHKYPVCVKSPFIDEGEEHSPLIGWAFDGYPIYGPYESKGLMARDAKDHPLNDFNLHHDEERGWHYHVTPGRYPYVLGGYWGEVDPRNQQKGKGPKKGPPKK